MRATDSVRLALAATCIFWPTLPALMTRTNPSDVVVSLTRILAARYGCHVAMAGLVGRWGSQAAVRRLLAVGASVEACHAVSMFPLAALFPDDARLAAVSGGVAAGLAVADLKGIWEA